METKGIMALIGCAMTILGITSIPWVVSTSGKEYTALAIAGYSAASAAYSYGILAVSVLGILASAVAVFNPSPFCRKIIGMGGGLTILGWIGAAYHLANTQQLWVSQYIFVSGPKVFGSVGFYLLLLGGMLSVMAAVTMGEPQRQEETETLDMSYFRRNTR